MSVLVRAALACALITAPVFGQPAAGPKPATQPQAQAGPAVTPLAAPVSEVSPNGPPESAEDPVLRALHAEVERLRKASAEADSANADEISRLRARVQVIQELLLLVIQQQELIYLQNKALLARIATVAESPTPTGSAKAAPAKSPSPAPKASGPIIAKKGGGGKAHRPGCMFGERITPSTRTTFATLAQAIAAGYQPCKVCKP